MAIKQAIATLGIEARRIEDLAERMKDRPEGATLFGIAARIRQAIRRLGEVPAS